MWIAATLIFFAVIALVLHFRRPGFGATFAVVNMGDTDIHGVELVVSGRCFQSGSLCIGEHSMNGFHPFSRHLLPAQCEVRWTETPSGTSATASVSLKHIPADARTGMLLIVRSGSRDWVPEYCPTLDFDILRNFHEVSGYNQRFDSPHPSDISNT